MIRQLFVLASTVVAFITAPLSAQVTIEKIAPENSVLVIGTKNMQGAVDHFKATGMWDLLQTDKMKAMRADAMKEMAEGVTKMFQELGVEEDSLVYPAGGAGIAVFSTVDKDMGVPQIGYLIAADYGDAAKAEKTDKLILAALERGEKDNEIEFEKKDVNGKTIYSIDMSKVQEKGQAELEDVDLGGDALPIPIPSADKLLKGFKNMHYVRDGNSLMFCSDMNSLTEAMDSADGKVAANGGLAGRPDFQTVMGKIGENDMYAVLLTRDFMDLVSSMDESGMMGMVQPMIRGLVGEVRGYGYGAKFDGSTAMMEQNIFAYMPNGKQGLTTLIDTPAPRPAVPSFVGPDAVSYTSINVKFDTLMDVIRKVVSSNPMLAAQAGDQMEMIEPIVKGITATLGTQVHMTSSVTKPITETSMQSVTAIQCLKPQEFENAFGALATQMGIEPRDFLGQRIYTLDPAIMGGMMPMPMGGEAQPVSFGIGGGFVVIGPTPAVEQALRATGQPAVAGLASEAEFQRAANALPKDDVVAWGFSDVLESTEAGLQVQELMSKKAIEEIRKEDPEFADEMEASIKESKSMMDKMDFALMRQHIGPAVWQLQSTEDGFVFRMFQLSASDAKK